MNNSKFFLSLEVNVSKIKSQKKHCKQIIKDIQDTIKVGNLGTKPVSRKSINTGTNAPMPKIKKIAAITEKNDKGLNSLNKLKIVKITLNPSE